jgi:UDP-glucose 4-epimerase
MLANYSYEVYGIDNVPSSYDERFARLDIIYDVNEASWLLSDIPTEFDTIIHLAAMVKVNESIEKPLLYYDTNVNGTVNLLQRLEFQNFLFASTGAAESCSSPYAVSKRATEDIVAEYCTKMKRNFINYRFYNVVGSDGFPPTNPDGLFYNLIKAESTGVFKVYGDDWNTRDGTCVRDYLHVNEVAKALINGIENPTNQIENLGSGNGTTVSEMIGNYMLANKCRFNIQVLPRRPGDVESMVLKNVSPLMEHMYSLKELMMKP